MDQVLPTAAPLQPLHAAARCRAPAGRVEWIEERAGFDALAQEWDALVARTDDQLFYRHALLALWLDSFAPQAQLRVLLLRDGGGRLRAALPLLWKRVRVYGIPARALCSIGNLHSCRFDLLAEDPAGAAEAFLAQLLAQRDWDLLQLADVPPGGRADALRVAAERRGLAHGHWHSIVSPWLPLPPEWRMLERRLGTKMRSALRRRRLRLQARGAVTLQRCGSGELERGLEEALALEAAGWKGRAGTAIAQDDAARRFYTELARDAATRGAMALWLLRVDARLVAFQYAIEHRGRCLLLKQGYDEAFRDCGPGQLLMEDVLRDAIRRNLTEMDLLGDDSPAKRAWTDAARRHTWVFVFRGAHGRVLHALKFGLVPRLRRLLARLRRG